MAQENDVNELLNQGYVPSSLERKKALLMYLLFGIFMVLFQKQLSVYEEFHLRQAIGRRVLFLLCFVVSIFLIFLPYVWVIPRIVFISLLIVLFIFVRQAYKGLYGWPEKQELPQFFPGLGSRVLTIFEIDTTESGKTDTH